MSIIRLSAIVTVMQLLFNLCCAEEKFLLLKIPHLHLEGVSLEDALQTIDKIARSNGAEKKGYRGYVLSTPTEGQESISMNLRDVPVAFVFEAITNISDLEYRVDNGTVVFTPRRFSIFETVFLSTLLQDALGIKGNVTDQGIKDGLIKLGIRINEGSKIILSDDKQFAAVEISSDESVIVRSLVSLLNRGISINSR